MPIVSVLSGIIMRTCSKFATKVNVIVVQMPLTVDGIQHKKTPSYTEVVFCTIK